MLYFAAFSGCALLLGDARKFSKAGVGGDEGSTFDYAAVH